MNQAIWLKGHLKREGPFFHSSEHGNPNRTAQPVDDWKQDHKQRDASQQIGSRMRKHAKLHPPPCIETHQGHEQCDPKRHGQRVAHVSSAKVKARLSLKILAARRTGRVHLGCVLEVVGIAVHEQITLPTLGTTVAQDPLEFGHAQMCRISLNSR